MEAPSKLASDNDACKLVRLTGGKPALFWIVYIFKKNKKLKFKNLLETINIESKYRYISFNLRVNGVLAAPSFFINFRISDTVSEYNIIRN